MKKRTAMPAPWFVVLCSRAFWATDWATAQPVTTKSMPIAPVRNLEFVRMGGERNVLLIYITRLGYRGATRAMMVPLMKDHAVYLLLVREKKEKESMYLAEIDHGLGIGIGVSNQLQNFRKVKSESQRSRFSR